MAYTKHTWAANEIIDHTKLNHIEDGVAGTDAQFAELWEIVDEAQAAIGQIMENFQNKKLFFDMLHPVGSFYWTTAAGSPVAQGLSDGTWEQVTGRFLMAAGGGYTSGTTGGEASHLLTLNELPPHRHDMEIFTNHVSGSLPGGNYVTLDTMLGTANTNIMSTDGGNFTVRIESTASYTESRLVTGAFAFKARTTATGGESACSLFYLP